MKESTKKALLIGAGALLAAGLAPYELKREENGDFSYTSLLLGIYRRRHPGSAKPNVTLTICNAPCFTAESRRRRDAALRHAAEVAAERALFADEDDPSEGAASVPVRIVSVEEAAAMEAAAKEPCAEAEEDAPCQETSEE